MREFTYFLDIIMILWFIYPQFGLGSIRFKQQILFYNNLYKLLLRFLTKIQEFKFRILSKRKKLIIFPQTKISISLQPHGCVNLWYFRLIWFIVLNIIGLRHLVAKILEDQNLWGTKIISNFSVHRQYNATFNSIMFTVYKISSCM